MSPLLPPSGSGVRHWNPIATGLATALAITAISLAAACARPHSETTTSPLMTPMELSALTAAAPDYRVAYGADSSQYGELRIPPGPGPHPVVILVHGGCFKAAYATTRDLAAMADAFKADGIATWSVEYRRLGQPGGGWPGTYLDVGRAVDHLRMIAAAHHLNLDRVVVIGHSAGGHLAMWTVARGRVPANSPLSMPDPLPVRGVIDLAGPLDLTAHIPEYEGLCHDTVITGLLGGAPSAVPDRYAQASPMALLPLGVPQVIVIGEHEDFVPRPLVEAYADAARRKGDAVRVIIVPEAGHFEIASPRTTAWPKVEAAAQSLLNGRLPAP